MWARRCSVISKLIALTCFLSLAPFLSADEVRDKPSSIDFGPDLCGKSIDITAKGKGVLLKDDFDLEKIELPITCGLTLYTTTSERLSVNLRFAKFNVQNCKDNKLEIFDGPGRSFPMVMGGCTRDRKIISSGNSLYILLTITYKNYVKAQIQAQDFGLSPSCRSKEVPMAAKDEYQNMTIRENMGNLRMVCNWKIMADSGKRVEIEILSIDLGAIEGCTLYHLLIFDGKIDNSKILARLCGKDTPKYTTTQDIAYVQFGTDGSSGRHKEVKFRYRQIASPGNSGEKAGRTVAMICLSVLFAIILKAF